MFNKCAIFSAIAVVGSLSMIFPALALDTDGAKEMLASAFRCPVPAQEIDSNALTKEVNEYSYVPSNTSFHIKIKRDTLVGSSRGKERTTESVDEIANYGDIDSVTVEGDDVSISCRSGRQCFKSKSVLLSSPSRETNSDSADELSFKACDSETANNIGTALEILLKKSRK